MLLSLRSSVRVAVLNSIDLFSVLHSFIRRVCATDRSPCCDRCSSRRMSHSSLSLEGMRDEARRDNADERRGGGAEKEKVEHDVHASGKVRAARSREE